MRTVVILSCLMACEPEPAPPAAGTCDLIEGETPSLDVSHYSEFGDAPEIVYCGIPPQGGAPYAPFGVRLRGVEPDDLGVNLILTAVDLDTGEEIGVAEYNQVMICSNVGNNAGYWVGAELHMRFFGFETEELHDRDVRITIQAGNTEGSEAELAYEATLDCDPLS